jgi:hypothetical protein
MEKKTSPELTPEVKERIRRLFKDEIVAGTLEDAKRGIERKGYDYLGKIIMELGSQLVHSRETIDKETQKMDDVVREIIGIALAINELMDEGKIPESKKRESKKPSRPTGKIST